MINAIMRRVLVVFVLDRATAHICTAALFALAKVFFAFVAAGVAAVILNAHVLREVAVSVGLYFEGERVVGCCLEGCFKWNG